MTPSILTGIDFKTEAQNFLLPGVLMFTGCGVACAVNMKAHDFFQPEENGAKSIAIRVVAFAAGTAASLILTPRAALITFTGQRALELLGCMLIAAGLAWKESAPFPFLFLGPMATCSIWPVPTVFITAGLTGAALGAVI